MSRQEYPETPEETNPGMTGRLINATPMPNRATKIVDITHIVLSVLVQLDQHGIPMGSRVRIIEDPEPDV